jgi:hypothetical protein
MLLFITIAKADIMAKLFISLTKEQEQILSGVDMEA